jgi:hypothetical protein
VVDNLGMGIAGKGSLRIVGGIKKYALNNSNHI